MILQAGDYLRVIADYGAPYHIVFKVVQVRAGMVALATLGSTTIHTTTLDTLLRDIATGHIVREDRQ